MEEMWRRTCTGTGLTRLAGGVLLGVGPVLELQAYVQLLLTIYPQVLGPHCSDRLANGADSILHHSVVNALTTGADVTTSVLGGKGGKDWDGVLVQQD